MGAPYEDLPWLMADFASFLNSAQFKREHPVARALFAHFFLVTIHPFGDGNGRVSRLVEAAIHRPDSGDYTVEIDFGVIETDFERMVGR